ncbi:DUF2231 domain-containing protein [Pelagibacterium sediminicola]|uniref:DUF2231 domain-containing protein n=1 Tax=Pelagibacterium sediminicola TaxID=2248761 RepID=UPI000E30E9B3|nr:DUF2231 domain-containing protein [Pelagibacterium sediminicola]
MEPDPDTKSPIMEEVASHSVSSVVAVAGHPVHAMLVHFPIALIFATLGIDIFYWFTGDIFFLRAGVWAAGFAFALGVVASIAGTAELLLVEGIRVRVGSWTHAVAAMTLLSMAGANWGVRLYFPEEVLPHGLVLSVLSAIFAGLAGWHGGKLVFDHGVGLMVSPDE